MHPAEPAADQPAAELPIACTLGPDDGQARMARWRALSDRAAPNARRQGPDLEVRYRRLPGVRAELDALATAERECCAFVTWQVSEDGDHVVLHVVADSDTPEAVVPIATLFGAG